MVETKKKYFQVLEYYDSEVLNVVTVLELVGNCGTLVYVREHARSFGQDSGSSALIFWATRKCGCTHRSVGTWRAAQINGSWGRTTERLRGSPGQRTVLRVSGPLACRRKSVSVNSDLGVGLRRARLTVNYNVKQSQFIKSTSKPRASDPEEFNEAFDRAIRG